MTTTDRFAFARPQFQDLIGAIDFAGITDYRPDGPFLGGGLIVRAGQVVYPWLSLGLTFTGVFGAANDQRLRHFALLAEFDIYPAPSLPLSLRLAAGAGGGRATEPGRDDRPGLFGAAFQAIIEDATLTNNSRADHIKEFLLTQATAAGVLDVLSTRREVTTPNKWDKHLPPY